MSAEIPRSNGIFPPVEDDTAEGALSALETQAEARNYTSVYEDKEAAPGELDRLAAKGFIQIIPKEEAVTTYRQGTISKLALILKMKPKGQMETPSHHRPAEVGWKRLGKNPGKDRPPKSDGHGQGHPGPLAAL